MKNNKYWCVPLIVGCIVGVIGIALTIIGAVMDVPSMDSDGWFEVSSMQTFYITFGPFLIFAGFMVAISSFSIHLKNKFTFGQNKNNTNTNTFNPINNAWPELLKKLFKIKDTIEEEAIYCEYCDGKLPKDETKCPNCGAKVKKK